MTKKEFLRLPIWQQIPVDAEIIGTVFAKVVHKDEHGRAKIKVVGGMITEDASVYLVHSTNRVTED